MVLLFLNFKVLPSRLLNHFQNIQVCSGYVDNKFLREKVLANYHVVL
jgi:hypothetical protein